MSNIQQQEHILSLFNQSRFAEIIDLFNDPTSSLLSDPVCSQILAACYFKLGNFSQALVLLESLESSMGDSPDYLSLYGATCRRLGRLNDAMKFLNKACSLQPESLIYRNNLANVLIDAGDSKKAEEILKDILSKDPNYEDAKLNLNRLTYSVSQADQDSNQIQDSDNTLSFDPIALAFADQEVAIDGAKIRPKAVTASKKLSESLPTVDDQSVGAERITLAAQANSNQQPIVALGFCKEALSLLGPCPEIYVNASDAYLQLKAFHEAELCLLHSMTLGEPSLPNFINLISLLLLRGDWMLASKYLERANALFPGNPRLSQQQDSLNRRKDELSSAPFQFPPLWEQPTLPGEQISLQ